MQKIKFSRFMIVLIGIMVLCFGRTITSSAQTDMLSEENEEDNSTVTVEFNYIDAEEDGHLIGQNLGVLIGDQESGAAYVITNADVVELSDEEQATLCEQFSIADEDTDKIATQIQIVVTRDVKITATIKARSEELNLAILQLEQTIYDKEPAIFNLDEDAVKSAQTVYVWNDSTGEYEAGVATDVVMVNGISYVQHNVAINENNLGGGLVNSTGELLGMNQNTMVDVHGYSLSVKEIATILKALGVPYLVADHTDYSVDTTALSTAVEIAQKIDLSGYTDESTLGMKEALVAAQELLLNDEATQEEVDAMYQTLVTMQDSLQENTDISKDTLVVIIVAIVLLVIIVGLIAFIVWEKKKRKKIEIEKEEYEKKKAPINQGPYVPGKTEYNAGPQFAQQTLTSIRETATPSSQLEGFAPSSTAIRFNVEDTTILGSEYVEQEVQAKLFLVRNKTQEKIPILGERFVIGKSTKGTDYQLDNVSVSREHAVIQKQGNSYQLMDCSSTNGTYLNGKRLEAGQPHILNMGDTIRLADEEFTIITE